MGGFNLTAQRVFLNHPFWRRIGLGTEIEHYAPTAFGAIVEPLGNDQDRFFDPSAMADMMRAIDLVLFAFADDDGICFDVEFMLAFAIAVKHGIGIESGDIAVPLAEFVDGFCIIATTVIQNGHPFWYTALDSTNEGLVFAPAFIRQAQEDTSQRAKQ